MPRITRLLYFVNALPTLLSITILVTFAGCAVTDFVGAYFNTYYNAERLFVEAEAEVLNFPPDPKQAAKTFFPIINAQASTRTKLTTVIEKCSKLLQYHPDSKLVDDALIMIGKSYYYQDDNQQAERKFKELLEKYPESSLAYEAKQFLGQAYYRMGDRQGAVRIAKDLVEIATANDEPEFIAHGSLLLGQVEFDEKNFTEAVKYFQIAAEKGETPDYQSAAYLRLAELHVQQSEFEKAILVYDRAEDLDANYVGVYRARIGRARMLSKLGKHEASQSLLQELLSNTNYKEFYGEIELETGNVFADMDDYLSALAQYRYVDTTYAHTEASANSYYQEGVLYETKLFQYDSAQASYNKGRTEFTQAPITVSLVRRSEYMNKYRLFRREIAKYDSIKIAILYPPDTLDVQVDSTGMDSSSVRVSDSSSVALGAHSVSPDSVRPKVPPQPSIPLDTVEARLAYNKTELAGLFYSVLGKVDSAEFWYTTVLADHPNSVYVPRAMFTLAQLYSQDSSVAGHVVDSLHREIVSRFPESEFAAESKRLLGLPPTQRIPDRAEELYSKGERLIASGSRVAAIDTLRLLVKKYPDSPFASKAQYAIGWLYEQDASRSDSAVSSYQLLVNLFPNSQYAVLVKPKLAEVEQQKQAARQAMQADSIALADSTARRNAPKPPLEKNKQGDQEEQLKKDEEALKKQEEPIQKDQPETPPVPPENDPKEDPKQL